MKVSNTYRRVRVQHSMNNLAEKSSDLIDYRSRLIYINLRTKHPLLHPTIAKALASERALFVTIFQAPMEWFGRLWMRIRLSIANLKIKAKKHDA